MKFNLWVKQNSPEILMVSAIVNAAASVGLGIYAAFRTRKVIGPAKKEIVKCHNTMNDELSTEEEVANAKKDLRKTYVKTGGKLLLLYSPAAIALGLSIASTIGSHNILKGRNVALASALTALKTSYDVYRDRVKEKIGEEAEEELFNPHKTKEEIKKNSKGKEVIKKSVSPDLDDENDIFGAFWGPGNERYDASLANSMNLSWLLHQEEWLTQRLQAKGYLFLSDVYETLGITPRLIGEKRLRYARMLGWVYKPGETGHDSVVDFGLHDNGGRLFPAVKAFQSGREDFVHLNFNCDGDILNGDDENATFMKAALKKSY